MKNQRVTVLFYTNSSTAVQEEIHYTNKVLTEKEFKKWYNHIFKKVFNTKINLADVFAVYEDENGNTCELAQHWGMEEMKNNPVYPFV